MLRRVGVEDVSAIATSLNDARTELFEFAAEFFHVDFDGVGEAVELIAPDAVEDAGAGEDGAGVLEEEAEEGKFFGGQGEGLTGAEGLLGGQVGTDVESFEEQARLLIGAAEEGADTGEEFFEGEGFTEIIVGTGVESPDALWEGIASSEEEDGCGAVVTTEAGEDLESVFAGEPPVEEDEIP